jgi:7-cyano-7-deazaguanine synthase in queuosine biosynthesis
MTTLVDQALEIMVSGLSLKPGAMINLASREHERAFLELADECYAVPERPANYGGLVGTKFPGGEIVVLVSGGLDSTIAYEYVMRDRRVPGADPGVVALHVDLGHNYAEREKRALQEAGIEARIVNLSQWANLIGRRSWKHIIPGRNLLFLAVAADHLLGHGEIWLASLEGEMPDRGGDKSYRFLELARRWIRLNTGQELVISTLDKGTKADWIAWWIEQGYALHRLRKTVTCFSGTDKHCGRCQACLRRYVAFAYNDIDIAEDFEVHPMQGGKQFVDKYRGLMSRALEVSDFSRYSRRRCEQTLSVIGV